MGLAIGPENQMSLVDWVQNQETTIVAYCN